MKYVILTMVLVAGCAQSTWHHQTANQQQFARDKLECEYEAQKATAGIRSGIEAGYEQGSLQIMCMKVRGYELRPNN